MTAPAPIDDSEMITGGRKLPSPTDKYIKEVASDCITFEGRARSQGALTNNAVWLISRTIYLGSGQFVTQFALNASYAAVWDNKETYFDSPGACTPPFPWQKVIISDGEHDVDVNPDGSLNIGGTISIQSVITETIDNFTLTVGGTEYSYILPVGTKSYRFKLRSGQYFRYATVALATASNYATEQVVEKDGVSGASTRTIYFRAESSGEVMEVSYWV